MNRARNKIFAVCRPRFDDGAVHDDGRRHQLVADRDVPIAAVDRPADIDDLRVPGSQRQSKLVIIFTVYGFIVPSEAVNFSAFDPRVRYLLALETTGDAMIDKTIDVRFSPRTSAEAPRQLRLSCLWQILTAPTTPLLRTARTTRS
jgi:hypothetical protein